MQKTKTPHLIMKCGDKSLRKKTINYLNCIRFMLEKIKLLVIVQKAEP